MRGGEGGTHAHVHTHTYSTAVNEVNGKHELTYKDVFCVCVWERFNENPRSLHDLEELLVNCS